VVKLFKLVNLKYSISLFYKKNSKYSKNCETAMRSIQTIFCKNAGASQCGKCWVLDFIKYLQDFGKHIKYNELRYASFQIILVNL
jgi:hypothetical protein